MNTKLRFTAILSIAGISLTSGMLGTAATASTTSALANSHADSSAVSATTAQEEVQQFIDDVKALDPEGFAERVEIAQTSPKLDSVLDQLPSDEQQQQYEVLAAAVDDPEALEGTMAMFEMDVFLPYIDANGDLQVDLDEEQLDDVVQGEAYVESNEGDPYALDPPHCAAAVGVMLAFLAARAPACYAIGVLNPVAGVLCAAGTIAADAVVDWNAACD